MFRRLLFSERFRAPGRFTLGRFFHRHERHTGPVDPRRRQASAAPGPGVHGDAALTCLGRLHDRMSMRHPEPVLARPAQETIVPPQQRVGLLVGDRPVGIRTGMGDGQAAFLPVQGQVLKPCDRVEAQGPAQGIRPVPLSGSASMRASMRSRRSRRPCRSPTIQTGVVGQGRGGCAALSRRALPKAMNAGKLRMLSPTGPVTGASQPSTAIMLSKARGRRSTVSASIRLMPTIPPTT